MIMTSQLQQSLERPPLNEGKTKRIFASLGNPNKVFLIAKDDITAGDGAKHDIIAGKSELANRTTCNVFRLLKACGIPVAFDEQLPPIELNGGGILHGFQAEKCSMLPYEVVVRSEAHGSYLKRAPHLNKGHVFPELVVEFYLKTSGRKWKDHDLVCDDPLMRFADDGIQLFDPKQPDTEASSAEPFLFLPYSEVFTRHYEVEMYQFREMADIARRTFIILSNAWQKLGRKLVDFKVEFGVDAHGDLLLADVIDNDSWRVLGTAGEYIDKQAYRDGGDLNTVTAKYRDVAELTGRFTLPDSKG